MCRRSSDSEVRAGGNSSGFLSLWSPGIWENNVSTESIPSAASNWRRTAGTELGMYGCARGLSKKRS